MHLPIFGSAKHSLDAVASFVTILVVLDGLMRVLKRLTDDRPLHMDDPEQPHAHDCRSGVAVRLMIVSFRLMEQSKSIRSIIDATQQEQRHGSA